MAALATTTLSAGVGPADNLIPLSSVAGVSAGQVLFFDGEAVNVQGLVGSNAKVLRGYAGTRGLNHASGVTVYIGQAWQFYSFDPQGKAPEYPIVTPWINTQNGAIWEKDGDAWQLVAGAGGGSGSSGNAAEFEADADGVTSILGDSAVDRVAIVSVAALAVFADGDGTQPVFTIGYDGAADAFTDGAGLVDAAAGTILTYPGVLPAGKALAVTATPATGTGTGSIAVVAIAAPQVAP